ncbi:MAG: MFS transporter [Egibacteraceae bacterium]
MRTHRTSVAVLLLAVGGFVAIGLPEGTLGVAWPAIRATFDQPLSGLGIVLGVSTAGYLGASLGAGALSGRIGVGWLLTAAAATGSAGLLACATAPTWAGLIGGSLFVGLAGGVFDAAINAYVALRHGVRWLGLLHAAFGVGATAAPLALAALFEHGWTWRWAYLAVLVVEVVLLAGFAATRRAWSTAEADETAETDEADEQPPRVPGQATALVLLSVITFFVYVGIEATAGQWSFSLLTEDRGLSAGTAGVWVGSYWANLTAGRLLTGALGDRLRPVRVLDASMAGMAVGGALVWYSPTPSVAGFGFAILGFSAAAVFPTMIALTPARIGRDRAAAIIGYQVAAAALGGAVVPGFTGVLAEAVGLAVVGPVLVASVAILLILHRVSCRLAAR